MTGSPDLEALLEVHEPKLRAFVRRRSGRLLRYEAVDDLVQGVQARVLERGATFRDRGEGSFWAWQQVVAKSYLADRVVYWTALRRRPGALLRLTMAGQTTGAPGAVPEPAAEGTGPITFAQRREQLEAAVRALDLLLPRDRQILLLLREGHTTGDLARHLDLKYDAAEKARARAIERFRKSFTLVGGEDGG